MINADRLISDANRMQGHSSWLYLLGVCFFLLSACLWRNKDASLRFLILGAFCAILGAVIGVHAAVVYGHVFTLDSCQR